METPRLKLRNLIPGQSQRETTINETLHLLDAVVSAAIEGPARADPPVTPTVGATYLVAVSATGEWTGWDARLATYTPGGWRPVTPFEGLSALVKTTGETLRYRAGAWRRVLGPVQPAIANAVAGTTVDAECRAAVAQVLAALRAHGLIEA